MERIFLFADKRKIAISAIEKKAGISNGFLKKIKHSPSLQKCEDILCAFPELNKNWLLTGEGEMLNDSAVQEKNIVPEQENLTCQILKLTGEISKVLGSLEMIRDSDAGLLELLKSKEQQMERLLGSMETKDKQIDRFLDELAKMRESLHDKDMQIMRAFQLIEAIQKNDYAADERSGAASAAGG